MQEKVQYDLEMRVRIRLPVEHPSVERVLTKRPYQHSQHKTVGPYESALIQSCNRAAVIENGMLLKNGTQITLWKFKGRKAQL